MTPRAEKARALGIEQNDERLRDRVDLKSVIGAPRRGGGVSIESEALQHAPKAHLLGIEDPRAVAGLKDEQRIVCGGDHTADHARFIAEFGVECGSASLRNCDNPRLPS